jgi:2-polyprenyl-3-methyl-5-hydroxy-6-metoxy-1,4-benzoquinol methylase
MDMDKKRPIKDISEIDWNEVIKFKKEAKSGPVNKGAEFWDRRAPSFAGHAGKTLYSDSFIEMMNPDPSWTVLDMGCGGGTLAIPLAFRVKHITAVDFSEKMIEILTGEASRRGIKNISAIHASWTDNWAEKGIKKYDVAIASRSLAVDDVKAAIIKLDRAARRRVIISTIVGDGPFDRQMFQAVGREPRESIDYIYFYNLLYQMGIHASLDFIHVDDNKTWESHAEACESMRWMFPEMTRGEDELLRRYMSAHLVKKDGRFHLDYKKSSKWAVIRWDRG